MENITPEDVPTLWDLARRQYESDGVAAEVPRLFDDNDRLLANIPAALKMVIDGRLVQGHIFERQVELMTFGVNPRATALSLEHLPAAFYLLKRQGYIGVHARIPLSRLPYWEATGTLGKRLHMERDDERLAHFYRSLAVAPGEILR